MRRTLDHKGISVVDDALLSTKAPSPNGITLGKTHFPNVFTPVLSHYLKGISKVVGGKAQDALLW